MLLTDSDIITQADLAAYDPEVDSLSAEKFMPAISGTSSVIRDACMDACHQLTRNFQSYSGYMTSPGAANAANAAILNAYSTAVGRGRVRMNQVVMSEPDPARQMYVDWLKYSALYRFYRAVFHRKVDDRFEKKMNLYAAESQRAREYCDNTGLPIVLTPLACPGAVREYQNGTWGQSNVTAGGTGSPETGSPYDVAITYTGAAFGSWANTNSAESAPSAKVTVQAMAGQVIMVSIASLNPPAGLNPNLGTADSIYSPMPATGWNIYAGPSGGTLCLQNMSVLPLATKTFTFPSAPAVNGMTLPIGQAPLYYFWFVRTFSRA